MSASFNFLPSLKIKLKTYMKLKFCRNVTITERAPILKFKKLFHLDYFNPDFKMDTLRTFVRGILVLEGQTVKSLTRGGS